MNDEIPVRGGLTPEVEKRGKGVQQIGALDLIVFCGPRDGCRVSISH